MAVMYPKQINEHANNAEKKMYKILSQGLGHLNICYHNYNVVEKETDFIVVIPGEGIVVIEVKGWNGKNIEEVVDNNTIKYRNSNGVLETYTSPLKQANGYRYKLVNKLKEELGINIKVCSLVCYPFMSEEDFNNRDLRIVSDRAITILKDDLEDIHQFAYMLKRKYSHYIVQNVDPFNERNYIKIRKLFEKEKDIKMTEGIPARKVSRAFAEKCYSVLTYIPEELEGESFKKRIEQYYYKWLSGTKVMLIIESDAQKQLIYKFFEEKLEEEIAYLSNYEQFNFYDTEKKKYKNCIFNFEIYSVKEKLNAQFFELIDGRGCEAYKGQLKELDEKTDFNYRQYILEHHRADQNMIVKAGAGTGKTYSMVSRINYLYYSNKYAPEDLVNGIIMITFTNEAAQNMKVRLKAHFTNLAILTEDVEYLRVMENVSRMKISTIHSLCKKIIQNYSKYLGMGRSISIVSGIYERKLEIQKVLDEEISKNDTYKALLLKVQKHELISAVEYLLDELEKKNINLEKNYSFNLPNQEVELFELIKSVASKVQKNIIEMNIRDNTVHLSNLMIYLGKLIEELQKQSNIKEKVDYLFIDEFQDTDDVQIELIKQFYHIFNFKLFVVGDIKQSIYRFRGAEDKAFDKLKRNMTCWRGNEFTLNKNYRSDAVLLEQFDELFTCWSQAEGEKILEYNTELKAGENDEEEIIDRLIGVKTDPTIEEYVTCIKYDEATFEDTLIKAIKQKQKELDAKYQGKMVKGKPQKGKIAILVRKNSEIEKVRQICAGKVNLTTDATENLYQTTPTKDLYYLILAMQFNTSPKYLYAFSQTNYCRGISNRVVYQSKTSPQCIPEAFKNEGMVKGWTSYMEDLKKRPVLRVIQDMIEEIKPWNNYAVQFEEDLKKQLKGQTDEARQKELAELLNLKKKYYKVNLELLIEDIVQSSEEEYLTINKLEHYLYIKIFANQHQDERNVEEESGDHEVKCLTVHKSKGLEYDHIILPFVHSDITSLGMNNVIIEKDQIYVRIKMNNDITLTSGYFNKQINQEKQNTLCEEARILYVALTRAEDTVTWLKEADFKGKKNKKYWSNLLDKEV